MLKILPADQYLAIQKGYLSIVTSDMSGTEVVRALGDHDLECIDCISRSLAQLRMEHAAQLAGEANTAEEA